MPPPTGSGHGATVSFPLLRPGVKGSIDRGFARRQGCCVNSRDPRTRVVRESLRRPAAGAEMHSPHMARSGAGAPQDPARGARPVTAGARANPHSGSPAGGRTRSPSAVPTGDASRFPHPVWERARGLGRRLGVFRYAACSEGFPSGEYTGDNPAGDRPAGRPGDGSRRPCHRLQRGARTVAPHHDGRQRSLTPAETRSGALESSTALF